MNIKILGFIGIVFVGFLIVFGVFTGLLDINQRQMYPYNNTHLENQIGFICPVKCPYENHSDNLTCIHVVEEDIADKDMKGQRIRLETIWLCKKHNVVFSSTGYM